MPNIVNEIMGTLTRTDFFLPNGLWLITLGLVIYFFINRNQIEPFKRRSTKKEIRADLDFLSKAFGSSVNKRLDSGLTKSRFVLRQFPLLWDINTNIRKNIKKARQLKAFLKNNPDKAELDDKGKPTGKIKKEFEELYALKVCGTGLVSRSLAKIGFGTHYILIPHHLLDLSKDTLVLKPFAQPNIQFGVTIFSLAGREYLENIAYKLNRENELDEFVNQIPKQNYLEVSTASVVAKARERAQIEKEKYKGQLESAESG